MTSIYKVPIELREVEADEIPDEIVLGLDCGDKLPQVDDPKLITQEQERKIVATKFSHGQTLL